MKKLLLLLLLFPFVLSSCSSDDEYNYTESDLIGTWVIESKKGKAVKTNNNDGNKAIRKDIRRNKGKGIYTFMPEGKVTILNGKEPQSGTYILKDNTLIIDTSEEKCTIKINFSNNTISFDINETEYYAKRIKSLLNEEESEEKDAVVIRVITTYTYKKYSYSESDLVGTWVIESKKAKEVKTSNSEGDKVIKKDIKRNKSKGIYNFMPEGKVTISNGENSQSGIYILKDNTLILDTSEGKFTIKINISDNIISNNTISFDINETEYYTKHIKSLLNEEKSDEKDAVVNSVITTYTYKKE